MSLTRYVVGIFVVHYPYRMNSSTFPRLAIGVSTIELQLDASDVLILLQSLRNVQHHHLPLPIQQCIHLCRPDRLLPAPASPPSLPPSSSSSSSHASSSSVMVDSKDGCFLLFGFASPPPLLVRSVCNTVLRTKGYNDYFLYNGQERCGSVTAEQGTAR